MLGLNLGVKANTESECQDNLIYFSDDLANFQNNVTLTFEYTKVSDIQPLLPVMDFLKLFGGNLSEAVPNCYKTGEELIYDYYYNEIYVYAVNNNADLLLSFIFGQMTYAIQYKKAFDNIEENELTQNYLDNMTQYG